jgi:hypothetical protein
MKGRIALVFWLVVVLAVLTATASYAWLAMNLSASFRGIEVEAVTDSLFLEISAEADSKYDTSVSFGSDTVLASGFSTDDRISFITYRQIPNHGAIRITTVQLNDGTYNGSGRYFKAVQSDTDEKQRSFIDITGTLKTGDSLAGYFTVMRGSWYPVSDTDSLDYYYEHSRPGNVIDYISIGKVPRGERLAGRIIWGYATSDALNDAQGENPISVVSFDVPPPGYRLHRTVYLRCAESTSDAEKLCVDEVTITGRNYLENTMRIMFVATSGSGQTVTAFYNHREPGQFELFDKILGNEKEVITVDMYIFFDGSDDDAYSTGSIFTESNVTVKFSIDDHDYN